MSGEMNSTQATLWVFLRLPLLLRLRPAAPCSALTWSSIVLLASPRSSSPFTEMYWTRPFPLGAGGGEGTHPSMPPLKILYFFLSTWCTISPHYPPCNPSRHSLFPFYSGRGGYAAIFCTIHLPPYPRAQLAHGFPLPVVLRTLIQLLVLEVSGKLCQYKSEVICLNSFPEDLIKADRAELLLLRLSPI